jgi:hypothetical protein
MHRGERNGTKIRLLNGHNGHYSQKTTTSEPQGMNPLCRGFLMGAT